MLITWILLNVPLSFFEVITCGPWRFIWAAFCFDGWRRFLFFSLFNDAYHGLTTPLIAMKFTILPLRVPPKLCVKFCQNRPCSFLYTRCSLFHYTPCCIATGKLRLELSSNINYLPSQVLPELPAKFRQNRSGSFLYSFCPLWICTYHGQTTRPTLIISHSYSLWVLTLRWSRFSFLWMA